MDVNQPRIIRPCEFRYINTHSRMPRPTSLPLNTVSQFSPSQRLKCSQKLPKILSAVLGPAVVHLLDSVRGAGVPPGIGLPCEAHRALPWVGVTGCQGVMKHHALAAIPSWALRGEKPRSSRSRPGRAGITPPGFWAVETLEKPDNAFISGPGRPIARVLPFSRPN